MSFDRSIHIYVSKNVSHIHKKGSRSRVKYIIIACMNHNGIRKNNWNWPYIEHEHANFKGFSGEPTPDDVSTFLFIIMFLH